MINWQLHAYDVDERRWVGSVKGEAEYFVHRGTFNCLSDPEFGDAYSSEMDGINCCEAHYKYGSDWPVKIKSDPLLSQPGDFSFEHGPS